VRQRAGWIVALVMAFASTAAAEPWVRVEPEGAGLAADLPGTPTYESSSDFTVVGRVVEHLFTREESEATFWITWVRLPRVALWFAAKDGIFENVRKGFLERSDVSAGAFREVSLGSLRGRELEYVSEESGAARGRGRVRTFLRGRTLLVFDAVSRSGAGDAAVERFFASVRIDPEGR
jgi:hypothetical protein